MQKVEKHCSTYTNRFNHLIQFNYFFEYFKGLCTFFVNNNGLFFQRIMIDFIAPNKDQKVSLVCKYCFSLVICYFFKCYIRLCKLFIHNYKFSCNFSILTFYNSFSCSIMPSNFLYRTTCFLL